MASAARLCETVQEELEKLTTSLCAWDLQTAFVISCGAVGRATGCKTFSLLIAGATTNHSNATHVRLQNAQTSAERWTTAIFGVLWRQVGRNFVTWSFLDVPNVVAFWQKLHSPAASPTGRLAGVRWDN
eukprot:5927250-Amphidinium_carterae.1